MKENITIAIDGPAASGKGTIARKLAEDYGLRYLDTGLLYRAVAALSVEHGVLPSDQEGLAHLASQMTVADLERQNLRDEAIGRLASVVAAHPPVRAALLQWQRNFASGGAILDGRDIGTVVLPDADAKLFITASMDVRAERRFAELSKTQDVTLDGIRADLEDRDARDSNRSSAPMSQAEDADLLDTTEMTIEQAVAEAKQRLQKQLNATQQMPVGSASS